MAKFVSDDSVISIRLAGTEPQPSARPSCVLCCDASSTRCQASRQACVTEASYRFREAGAVARRVLLPPRAAPPRPPRLGCPRAQAAALLPAKAAASITIGFISFEAWGAVRGLGEWAQLRALHSLPPFLPPFAVSCARRNCCCGAIAIAALLLLLLLLLLLCP